MRRPTLGSIGRRRSADELAEGYARCRELTRAHGTTYYWGTLFLPPAQRRDVYGVYALCRLADDIVDEPDAAGLIDLAVPPGADPARRLDAFEERFYAEWEHGGDPHPILAAVGDTARRLDLPRDCFERFFGAMRLDLTRTSWSSWAELRDVYMEGSAAVIGEMMLPVLRPRTPRAKEPARALGLAFQLTNFIRDVGEDLDRGRVYLPADELARFGADPWARTVTPAWRDFLAAQIARNRALYREAEPGVAMLPPAAARCVGSALSMYSGILSRIEAADYDVFTGRRRVDPLAKTAVAARVVVTGRSRIAPRVTPPAPPPGSLDALPRTPAPTDPITPAAGRDDPTDPIAPPSPTASFGSGAGGWCVVGASGDLRPGASLRRVVGTAPVTLWRERDGRVQAGPVAGRPTVPALDDGTLLWARVPALEADPG
ncbi:phytoene/squalene synthase family protein, partial [Piscicoccus intestinalis]|uniref:phytoene/squalene synthase family protein n=1 Tax=Piscicoccus intestinalis TaxID=746033 RepID=UPI0012EE76E8